MKDFFLHLVSDNKNNEGPSRTGFVFLGCFFIASIVVLWQLFRCSLDTAVFLSFIGTFTAAHLGSKGINSGAEVLKVRRAIAKPAVITPAESTTVETSVTESKTVKKGK